MDWIIPWTMGSQKLDMTERLSLSKKLLTDSDADIRKNNEATVI